MIFYIIIKKLRVFLIFCFNTRDQDVDDVLFYFFLHFSFGVKFIMLCGNDDSVNAYRAVVIVIFERYLAFRVGTKVFDLFILPSKGRQY